MKKTLLALMLTTLSFGAFALDATDENFRVGDKLMVYVDASSGIKLRDELPNDLSFTWISSITKIVADTNFERNVVASLTTGEELVILGYSSIGFNKIWAKVKTEDNKTGWVFLASGNGKIVKGFVNLTHVERLKTRSR